MNDKIQLAAMGEHMAEQAAQPLCMAKRIEEFESKYKAAMEVVRDLVEMPYSTGGLMERLKVRERARDLLAGQVPEPVYYMRDNHTFKRLSDDVDTAITEIEAELDAGWTSGMLCSKRKGFSSLHANFRRPREEFISDCRDALLAATTKPEVK